MQWYGTRSSQLFILLQSKWCVPRTKRAFIANIGERSEHTFPFEGRRVSSCERSERYVFRERSERSLLLFSFANVVNTHFFRGVNTTVLRTQ